MALKKELIQFTILNNTDCDFNLPLLQRNVYSINATTTYTWDITTIDLSCGAASIVINGQTYNITFNPDLNSFLQALNNLNFGFFCTTTSGPNTYLYTQDDVNVYTDLVDCGGGGPTTTTTTTTTTAAPTTSTTTTTTTAAPTTTTTTSTTTTTTTILPTCTLAGTAVVSGI